jgi:hypothetical protein
MVTAAQRLPPAASDTLHPVLRLRVLGRLPLHVRRRIGTSARERLDMVHYVAGPAMGVSCLPHERVLRASARLAGDSALAAAAPNASIANITGSAATCVPNILLRIFIVHRASL